MHSKEYSRRLKWISNAIEACNGFLPFAVVIDCVELVDKKKKEYTIYVLSLPLSPSPSSSSSSSIPQRLQQKYIHDLIRIIEISFPSSRMVKTVEVIDLLFVNLSTPRAYMRVNDATSWD